MSEDTASTQHSGALIADEAGSGARASSSRRRLPLTGYVTNKVILAAVIVIICAITAANSSTFLTWTNWENLLQQVAIVGILAFGTTLLMVSGGIDLSIGSGVSLTGLVVAELLVDGTPVILAIVIAVAIAVGIGIINGVLAAFSRAHPFIITLGMMTLIQGAALLIATEPVSGLPNSFLNFSFEHVAGLPMLVFWALVIGIICQFILRQTLFGRRLYAIGGSQVAAHLAGVRVKTVKIAAYSMMGLLVGVAGVLMTSLLSAGQAYQGQGLELTAIAAVAVGGTPLQGGRGDVLGTALGVLLIGLITNSLNLLSINPNVQDVIVGLIIVVAVMAQRQSR